MQHIGHKASPGNYSFNLKWVEQQASAQADLLPNPRYPIAAETYAEYDRLMGDMEKELHQMHQLVNTTNAQREQLEQLLASVPAEEKYKNLHTQGDALVKKMKAWDEDMVQRKSKAYDDVENFPNKFTANYIFLINQTESDIPRVNQPSLDLKWALDSEWATLKARMETIETTDMPAMNKMLWDAGIGGIWKRF